MRPAPRASKERRLLGRVLWAPGLASGALWCFWCLPSRWPGGSVGSGSPSWRAAAGMWFLSACLHTAPLPSQDTESTRLLEPGAPGAHTAEAAAVCGSVSSARPHAQFSEHSRPWPAAAVRPRLRKQEHGQTGTADRPWTETADRPRTETTGRDHGQRPRADGHRDQTIDRHTDTLTPSTDTWPLSLRGQADRHVDTHSGSVDRRKRGHSGSTDRQTGAQTLWVCGQTNRLTDPLAQTDRRMDVLGPWTDRHTHEHS